MAEVSIDVDVKQAVEEMDKNAEDIGKAGRDIVDQLAVLAEKYMKMHAPEGSGSLDAHLRSTIRPEKSEGGTRAVIQPHKRTKEGWYLHHAIVGSPSAPTYKDEPPPVWSDGSGNAQGPIADWAAAKLGDPNIAWQIQTAIFARGQRSYPNRFIDRSLSSWESRVDDIADRQLREALR